MKKNTHLKLFAIIMTLALTLAAVFAISVFAQDADNNKTPAILAKNIEYGGNNAMMFAVDPETVAEGDVTLTMYKADKTTVVGTYTESVTEDMYPDDADKDVFAYIFTTKGVPAKDMGNYYYFEVEDSAGNKSEMFRYSVAEYMLERLYGSNKASDPDQRALYEAVLEMGAKAQTVLINNKLEAGETPATLVTDYVYFEIEGGTADGYTHGAFPKNTVITIVPEGSNTAWTVIYADGTTENVEGNQITLTQSCKITSVLPEDIYDESSYHFNGIDLSTVPEKVEAGLGVYVGEYPSTFAFAHNTTIGEDGKYSQLTASIVQSTKANGAVSNVLSIVSHGTPLSTQPNLKVQATNITSDTMKWYNDFEMSFDINFSTLIKGYQQTLRFGMGSYYGQLYFTTRAEDGVEPGHFSIVELAGTYAGADGVASTVVDNAPLDQWVNLKFVLHYTSDGERSDNGTPTGVKLACYVNDELSGYCDTWKSGQAYNTLCHTMTILFPSGSVNTTLLDNIQVQYVPAQDESAYPWYSAE